jgi:hypothetical protein
MTYQRFYKDKGGIILLDIIVALALSGLWISLMMEVSGSARTIFNRAKLRNNLLNVYEQYARDFYTLNGYESKRIERESGFSIEANSVPYGNEMTEVRINVRNKDETMVFVSIHQNSEGALNDQSVCSVDFSRQGIVGSYEYLSENYDNEFLVEEIRLPLDPTLPLTDFVVRDGVAIISADSSRVSDSDIVVIKLSSSPEYIAGINTGPGISAISVFGNRLYAAAASAAAQLHVIDLSSLTLRAKYALPLPYATATPPFASAITYSSGKLFLGTEKWDGTEFFIIDVRGDAFNVEGGYEVGGKVNYVMVDNDDAYVATTNESQLLRIDISDLSIPVLRETFLPAGWQRQDGKVISVFENQLVFGRTSGGFNILTDHEYFSWATTSRNISNSYKSLDIPGGVYGIIQDRQNTFLSTRNYENEVKVVNADGDLQETIHLPTQPLKMTCDGGSLYLLSREEPVIYKLSYVRK